MVRAPVLLTTMTLVLFAACSEPPPSRQDVSGGDGIELLDGGHLDLDALGDRWLFVNYWAEWCAPCREEIPELNALQAEAPEKVRVLGVNFDQLPPEVMGPQAEGLGIRFAVAAEDPRDLLGIRLPEVLPSTYVFAPGGEQVGVLLGPQSLEQLRAAMAEH